MQPLKACADKLLGDAAIVMTNTAVRRLHFWYGIALGVFTAIVGILFISQAADIYYSGLDYSRELVIQRCTAIAAPFWIWVAAVAAGGILWTVFPPEKQALKRLPDDRATAEKLKTMLKDDCDDPDFAAAKNAVIKEEKLRRIVWLCCLGACAVCAVVACVYLFNLPSYPEDPNEAVLSLVRTALPCIAVAFAACIGAAVFDGISAKRILPQIKLMLAKGGANKAEVKAEGKISVILSSPVTLLAIRIAVLVAAVLLIIFGILNGGMYDVFGKAINICTECIGLG